LGETYIKGIGAPFIVTTVLANAVCGSGQLENVSSWGSYWGRIHPNPELGYDRKKCIGKKECGLRLKPPCPEGAAYVVDGPDDRVYINWDMANDYGEVLASVCPTAALFMFGKEMTVEQVLEEVEQDSTFYRESGGGITISGGECLCLANSRSSCNWRLI
jgi:pyruvate formate lyase activating enzyme